MDFHGKKLKITLDGASNVVFKGSVLEVVLESEASEANMSNLDTEKIKIYSQDSQNKISSKEIFVFDVRDSSLKYNSNGNLKLQPLKSGYTNNSELSTY